jgi:hypothetical protein
MREGDSGGAQRPVYVIEPKDGCAQRGQNQ